MNACNGNGNARRCLRAIAQRDYSWLLFLAGIVAAIPVDAVVGNGNAPRSSRERQSYR